MTTYTSPCKPIRGEYETWGQSNILLNRGNSKVEKSTETKIDVDIHLNG
jgi:hypothetical protein